MNKMTREECGIARAQVLTPERRKEIAKKASDAAWKDVAEVTHGSPDRPLRIGDVEIPCYVLKGDIRVLSENGLLRALGMVSGGTRGRPRRIAQFIGSLEAKGLKCNDLTVRSEKSIRFRPGRGGSVAYGYEATILADLCRVVLEARKKRLLSDNQLRYADQCEILMMGFARVGIIALVDEATGFQKDRASDALAKFLEEWVAKEIQAYVKTFPTAFYDEIFRLRGMNLLTDKVKKFPYFGILTNNIVYKRLAPGVFDELKKVTPRDEEGKLTSRYFQSLTPNKGYSRLQQHLASVVTLMKVSVDWHDFMEKLERIHPKCPEIPVLPAEYDEKKDKGKGL